MDHAGTEPAEQAAAMMTAAGMPRMPARVMMALVGSPDAGLHRRGARRPARCLGRRGVGCGALPAVDPHHPPAAAPRRPPGSLRHPRRRVGRRDHRQHAAVRAARRRRGSDRGREHRTRRSRSIRARDMSEFFRFLARRMPELLDEWHAERRRTLPARVRLAARGVRGRERGPGRPPAAGPDVPWNRGRPAVGHRRRRAARARGAATPRLRAGCRHLRRPGRARALDHARRSDAARSRAGPPSSDPVELDRPEAVAPAAAAREPVTVVIGADPPAARAPRRHAGLVTGTAVVAVVLGATAWIASQSATDRPPSADAKAAATASERRAAGYEEGYDLYLDGLREAGADACPAVRISPTA